MADTSSVIALQTAMPKRIKGEIKGGGREGEMFSGGWVGGVSVGVV